jgi:RNA polymerase sigma-70 factor (ECF subfamily)
MVGVACQEELPVREARAGDPEAWDALLRRHQLPLFAYVQELIRDEQASLDIVQETFIAAVRHVQRLERDDRFRSWLFNIAHQRCVQHWRKTARRPEPLDDHTEVLPDEGLEPDAWLLRHEQGQRVLECVDRLVPAQRSVLLLRYFEEFPLDEIAEITGVSVGTVKSRLHYAKRALRDRLKESGV